MYVNAISRVDRNGVVVAARHVALEKINNFPRAGIVLRAFSTNTDLMHCAVESFDILARSMRLRLRRRRA